VSGQSNIGATADDLFDCNIALNGGVWYKLSIPFAASAIVSTCNQANLNTQIAVYSGVCGSLVCEADDDDTDGCAETTRVVYDVEPQDIYIVVNGYGTAIGNFDLTISGTAWVSRW